MLHKTIEFSDRRKLEIHTDDNPDSPRNWDNLGTMVCFHQRYNLGDEGHGINHTDFGGWDEMERWIKHENPDCVILPLFLFDHSGITISTESEQFRACDRAGWDWGLLGFIFITRDRINEEYGGHGGRTDQQIEEYLRSEVAVYDQYLRDDVYGFFLREPPCDKCGSEGKEGDSCWGFYGDDPIENGMMDHLDEKYRDALMNEQGILNPALSDDVVKVESGVSA